MSKYRNALSILLIFLIAMYSSSSCDREGNRERGDEPRDCLHVNGDALSAKQLPAADVALLPHAGVRGEASR